MRRLLFFSNQVFLTQETESHKSFCAYTKGYETKCTVCIVTIVGLRNINKIFLSSF